MRRGDPLTGLHAGSATIPPLSALNVAESSAFATALAPLFEGAPGFLVRLAAARPFETEADLFDAARTVARSMPEGEQIELLDAHPRIGADPATVSRLSHAEQGYDVEPRIDPEPSDGPEQEYDAEPVGEATRGEQAWVVDELRALNDAYESRFGFRFVIFVAGRPREAIVPILERALRTDREDELRRGLDDVVLIAADRLARLRGEGMVTHQ